MMKRKRLSIAMAVVGFFAMALPVLAHHSVTAEFDPTKSFQVSGVISRLEWTNPHISIYVDAPNSDGKIMTYRFTAGPPSMLHRAGVNRGDFKIGDSVTVTGMVAKGGRTDLGRLQEIKYADGHVFVYRDGTE
jgi:hypothetical protein